MSIFQLKSPLAKVTIRSLLIAFLGSQLVWLGQGEAAESAVNHDIPRSSDAWQEYAAYLISHHLCAEAQRANSSWSETSETSCTSILTETFTEEPLNLNSGTREGLFLYALGDVQWSGYQTPTEFKADSGAASGAAQLIVPRNFREYETHRTVRRPDRPVARDRRGLSASVGNDAIPGALLVTILALVGIVAVARRDSFGRTSDVPGQTDLKRGAASISPMRSMQTYQR
jgi:hypothetical protein